MSSSILLCCGADPRPDASVEVSCGSQGGGQGSGTELVTRDVLNMVFAERDERQDARFAQQDARFAQLDARFAQLTNSIDARFAQLIEMFQTSKTDTKNENKERDEKLEKRLENYEAKHREERAAERVEQEKKLVALEAARKAQTIELTNKLEAHEAAREAELLELAKQFGVQLSKIKDEFDERDDARGVDFDARVTRLEATIKLGSGTQTTSFATA